MIEAIKALGIVPDMILVDAVTIPGIRTPQESIIQGDTKSISIAAASIIAKVTRDRMLKQYAEIYPEYDLINNKGYGTKHLSKQ
jgi:ribonuclease HII